MEPALVLLTDPATRDGVRAALEHRGHPITDDPEAADVGIVVADAAAARPLATLPEKNPRVAAIALGQAAEAEGLPAAWTVLPPDATPERFALAVERALEVRDLRLEVEWWRETHRLGAVAPDALPAEMVELALRLLRADASVVFVRGPTGKLVAGPTARPLAIRSVPPGGADRPTPERARLPAETLRRRSERLVRAHASSAVSEETGDGWLVGRVVGGTDRPHGVLWVARAPSRRPFDARDLAALDALVSQASLALDHHRLVADLRDRLAGLQSTRQSMEEDKRAAQVGRLAIEALRHLQAPLAYIRTNLRELAATEEVRPAGPAGRHLQYAFDGLARAETVAADMARLSEQRERVPIEIQQLVDAAISLAGPLIVPVFVEVDGHAVLLGHAARLAEALAEILRNASEAEGVSRIDVRCSRQGTEVTIEVVDDGEGIAADLLPRIREPFFSTRGRAGIGFTSACEGIEAGGGTVQIWSRAGIGTTVICTLPAQEVESDLAIAAEAEEEVDDLDTSDPELSADEPSVDAVPLAPLHRGWIDDDEEVSIAGGLDFSDLADLVAEDGD